MCGPRRGRRVKKLITNGSSVLKRSYLPFRYLGAQSPTLEAKSQNPNLFALPPPPPPSPPLAKIDYYEYQRSLRNGEMTSAAHTRVRS